MTYRFAIWCETLPEGQDLAMWSNQLWDAGCDDSSPGVHNGIPCVHFDREADSLTAAINSAVAAVRSTGAVVTRLEIPAEDLAVLEVSHTG